MNKYRINALLSNLPMKDYHKALKIIPKVIGVSANTFANYRNIRITESRDIPHQKVVQLERIFGLAPGGLDNFDTSNKTLRQLLNEFNDENHD
ncbi:hypothetical protein FW774_12095 [Pedobacter sp. BS3]|uniref:hypothetical protein n=1 Tax=Pedobacter sp. BS3 TaxID=2567937 RepID=UPI0011EF0BA1|nr:hypothetical protein [Pedobacter sp. BS3]TZF83039.1 hypothetical protein FW774_12095 [Pedobacter sp. BS3]